MELHANGCAFNSDDYWSQVVGIIVGVHMHRRATRSVHNSRAVGIPHEDVLPARNSEGLLDLHISAQSRIGEIPMHLL